MAKKGTKLAAFLLVSMVFLRNIWLGDDIFLTMRTLNNFVNGYGLVWNIGERVQIYTHPLWMFIILPFYALTKSPYVSLYLISTLTSLAVFGILIHKFAKDIKATILMTTAMVTSASFIDYSSSGLENPLLHLLALCFILVLLNQDIHPQKKLFWLTLCASASLLTRYDSILIYFPVLIYQIYKNKQEPTKTLTSVIKGGIPVIVWEAFSLLYYGFLFPNTFYAKAKTGLSLSWKFQHGISYFSNSLEWDPVTLLVVGAGIFITLIQKNKDKKALAIGGILCLLYILSIGGDFMAGRFFSNIFIISLALLFIAEYPLALKRLGKIGYLGSLIALVGIGLLSKTCPVFYGTVNQPNLYHTDFISNEKAFSYEMSFLKHYRDGSLPDWGVKGSLARKRGVTPLVKGGGLFGYYAGPEIYLLDPYVLADPLRARLPVESTVVSVGHYWRRIPAGYSDTLSDNFNNHIKNQSLAVYYDKLSLLVHGDLFVKERLIEIVKFNIGTYDYLIDLYMQEEPFSVTEPIKID